MVIRQYIGLQWYTIQSHLLWVAIVHNTVYLILVAAGAVLELCQHAERSYNYCPTKRPFFLIIRMGENVYYKWCTMHNCHSRDLTGPQENNLGVGGATWVAQDRGGCKKAGQVRDGCIFEYIGLLSWVGIRRRIWVVPMIQRRGMPGRTFVALVDTCL